jgi:hypothetical protein
MRISHIQRGGLLAAMLVMFGLVIPVPVDATPISEGGTFYLLNGIPVYTAPKDLAPGMWDIDTALSNSTIRKGDGALGYQYKIQASDYTSFIWTGNQLDQDLSNAGIGLAEGTFLGGGTITVNGKIRDAAVPYTERFDGELLVANVQSFRLRETDANSDILNSVNALIRIQVVGGWLFDTAPEAQLRGLYDMALVAAKIGPSAGGALVNFQSDLVGRQTFQLQFTRVIPDPSSLGLMMLGGIGMLVSRRRRKCQV